MKNALILALAVAVLAVNPAAFAVERKEEGKLVIEGIPEIHQEIKDRMVQFRNTRGAGGIGWVARGEGIYIRTRFGETSQIHYVAKPGGAREQITFFDEPVGGAAVCPDPGKDLLLFSKDTGEMNFIRYSISMLKQETTPG